jgi:hypothetical protein
MVVNTSKVTGRRKLQFDSLDDVVNDVDRILVAQSSGELRVLGNWTAGQILAHLASWAEYPYKGYPMKPPVWLIRFILKRMLPRTLAHGMSPGVKIPGIAGGTTGQEDQPIDLAGSRYKKALERLKSAEPAIHHSPAFGLLPHSDIVRLQLRHAELHLSFIVI